MVRIARVSAGLTILGILAMWALSAAPAARHSITVVMRGLDNPRGLAIGPEGALYVVEAGRGGPKAEGTCQSMRGDERCYGPTGALTRVWHGRQERVATKLPSHIGLNAQEVTGPHDVSFLGRGAAFITIGLGGDPAKGPAQLRAGFGPSGHLFGTLVQVAPGLHRRDFGWDDDDGPFWFGGFFGRRTRSWHPVADIAAYEEEVNPGGGPGA